MLIGGWALIEDERPYEADEAPLVARWTVPQTNGLVFGGTASRVETDDDAFECEGRDKGEGTGSEPDDSNKAADTQGRVALIEDKRPFKAEKAVVEALRTVLQINILVVGGTARGEADDDGALDGNIDNGQSGNDEAGEDDAFECEGRDKGEGTGSEPDDSNKAADTQGRVALIEDKRPFKAEKAVVEALRTVLQINILVVGGTARGEADNDGALDGNIDNGQSGNDEAGEDVANEEKAVDNEAADEYHLVSTLSGAGGLESAARSAKCMNLGCQGSQWKILGNGKFSEQQGGKQFELNAGSSVGEDDAGESS